ncbi:MAG: hypothetical protein ABSC22_14325 [Roseiarcus sp.]|jgi:hypothetical protein
MTEAPLSPASPDDLADPLAFALRFDGRKRKHDAGEIMAAIGRGALSSTSSAPASSS